MCKDGHLAQRLSQRLGYPPAVLESIWLKFQFEQAFEVNQQVQDFYFYFSNKMKIFFQLYIIEGCSY